MTHKFSIEIAEKVGVNAAILYDNILWWCKKNEASENNFYEERYWTYNSIKSWGKLFPYLGESQIKTALNKLKKEGFIIEGNYNKSAYDRTKWYSYNDLFHLAKIANGKPQNRQPIPDNKPDNKTNTKKNAYNSFITFLKTKVSKPSKVTATKTGQELFSKVTDINGLINSYIQHQEEKKDFATRITAYMEDYITGNTSAEGFNFDKYNK